MAECLDDGTEEMTKRWSEMNICLSFGDIPTSFNPLENDRYRTSCSNLTRVLSGGKMTSRRKAAVGRVGGYKAFSGSEFLSILQLLD